MIKFAASVSLAALTLASCATTPPAQMAAEAPPSPRPKLPPRRSRRISADRRRRTRIRRRGGKGSCSISRSFRSRAAWVNATYINDDTDALAAYFGTIGTEKGVKYASEAARYAPSPGSISTRRASSISCAAH